MGQLFWVVRGWFTILFLAVSANVYCSETVLVKEGKPQAIILLSAQATETEKYAAKEFQKMIAEISGVKLEINQGEKNIPSSTNVIIGTPGTNLIISSVKNKLGLDEKEPEQIVVMVSGGTLFLAGNKPEGALYAVYAFLEKELGARWFWPGENGTYLPKMASIRLQDVLWQEKPAFQYRGYHLCGKHYDEETEIWMARNRLNFVRSDPVDHETLLERKKKGLKIVFSGHNLGLSEEYFQEHPEYFVEIGGKRQLLNGSETQVCWSNVQVQNLLAKMVEEWWREYPKLDMIQLFARDNPETCQCEECAKMAPDVSTRFYKLLEIIIGKVNKISPGKKYATLAYQGYKIPPTIKPVPGMYIQYCLYDRCYKHTFEENCPAMENVKVNLENWKKSGNPMGIYGYEFDAFNSPMFLPLAYLMADQLRYFQKIGFVGFDTEVNPPSYDAGSKEREDKMWFCNRFTLYAGAKLMWEPDISPGDLLRDWSKRIYGPAAEPMEKYYLATEKAWRESPGHVSYISSSPGSAVEGFINSDLINTAQECFQKARKSVDSNVENREFAPRIKNEIDLEEKMFQKWIKLYELNQKVKRAWNSTIPFSNEIPTIGSNKCWSKAVKINHFVDQTGNLVDDQTEVSLLWTKKGLYISFRCYDSDTTKLVINNTAHDSNVWADDSIELFVDPQGTKTHYYHLALNPKGIQYDASATVGMNFDTRWNGPWFVKTLIEKDCWTAIIELPFSSFETNPQTVKKWLLGINRSRANKKPNSSWTDGSYHNLNSFREVFFERTDI